MTAKNFLTIEQAAEYLNVSQWTIRRMIKSGELTAYARGRVIRIRPADLEAVLKPTDAWLNPKTA